MVCPDQLGRISIYTHGLSNAVLLLDVMEFSISGAPKRYADIAIAMGEQINGLSPMKQADASITAVERLVNDIQMPRLGEIGIDKTDFDEVVEKMAADAIASGSPANNPRQATQKEIIQLYNRCFAQR